MNNIFWFFMFFTDLWIWMIVIKGHQTMTWHTGYCFFFEEMHQALYVDLIRFDLGSWNLKFCLQHCSYHRILSASWLSRCCTKCSTYRPGNTTWVQVYCSWDLLRFLIRYNPLIARWTKHLDPQATWRAQRTWIWYVRYRRSSTFPNKRPALEVLHDNLIQGVLYMYPKQLAKQSLQVVCCGKRSCFAHDTPSLASWWHLPSERLPSSVCFGRYWRHDQWRSIFWMIIKLHNSTKMVEHKNHSLLKRTELDKNILFWWLWWHDFFAQQQLGAVLPTLLRQNRHGEAGLAALHGCMFRFVRPDGSLSGWLGQRILSGC